MQKFNKGDHVKITRSNKDCGAIIDGKIIKAKPSEPFEAIIKGSYSDLFGYAGNPEREAKTYSVFLKGGGSHAWNAEEDIELIEADRLDLLEIWEKKEEKEIKEKSDLDWIFSHGKEVLEGKYGMSVQALGTKMGNDNLWGSRGEFFVYKRNADFILDICKTYLIENDRKGFEIFAKRIKEEVVQ